jgi:hypothetical protein
MLGGNIVSPAALAKTVRLQKSPMARQARIMENAGEAASIIAVLEGGEDC